MKWWKNNRPWIAVTMFGFCLMILGLLIGDNLKQCPECPGVYGNLTYLDSKYFGEVQPYLNGLQSDSIEVILLRKDRISIFYNRKCDCEPKDGHIVKYISPE